MQRCFVPALYVAVAACSSPADMSEDIGVEEAAAVEPAEESAQATLDRRIAAEAEAFSFSETQGNPETSFREFSYSWPRQVTAIAPLAAAFEKDRQALLAEQKALWAQSKEACPEEFASCRRNFLELEWQVVADTPRFLSLSSTIATYTGGAHGNYGRSSTVWDRAAEEQLDPVHFFTSLAALEEALGAAVCDTLNAERAKRRGASVTPDPDDWSSACVPMEDAVLFLGSSDGARFDKLGVYYGPYVAGAYAEGDFEFTLPVTAAVMEAIKPASREAFAIADWP